VTQQLFLHTGEKFQYHLNSQTKHKVKCQGDYKNTDLVLIDPNTLDVEYVNHSGDFNGEAKVRGFLASRKLRMNADQKTQPTRYSGKQLSVILSSTS
jgi:hypothetical protein